MATCSSCNVEVVPGTRWCHICHTNLVDPSLGKLASPGKRLLAFALDIGIPVFLYMIGLVALATGSDTPGVVFFLVLLAYTAMALVLFSRGTTPGKRVLGMRVIKEDGTRAGFMTMLIRETVGKLISGVAILLGFLWILLDKDNQGWHDKLMSTYVIA